MDFSQKYELRDPLPGQGTSSFLARQTTGGREVAVHLLVGGRTPENEALLERLRRLPPDSLAKLLEVGENEGSPYVVTATPPFLHLDDWLRQEEGAPASEPGEFTRMFLAEPQPPAPEPGEFTRMFQAQQPPPPPAVAPIPDPDLSPTATMRAASPPPEPAASVPVVEKPTNPGELTGTFPAMPAATMPSPPAPPAAEPEGPGEFTRMFQAPLVGRRPQTEWPRASKPEPPGEFTQFFRASPPAPAAPERPAGDGMPAFGNRYTAPPPGGADATGAFSAPPAPAHPQGPSEYTMLISRPAKTPPAPAPPPVSPGGMPQPIQVQVGMPQPVLPQASQIPYLPTPPIPQPQFYVPPANVPPATVTAAPSSSNWLLYAIIAVVSFLAGVGVTLLIVKH